MKIEAIVPAAGLGLRLRSKTPKALVKINNCPLIIHTLRNLDSHPLIRSIILVVRKKEMAVLNLIIKRFRLKKLKNIIEGGSYRRDSVYNGLKYIDVDTNLVIIHDGARPFVGKKIITNCIKDAARFGASTAAVPVKPTIKRIRVSHGRVFVRETLNRDALWEIQTPQTFRKNIIIDAHKKCKSLRATDDAGLVERIGKNVAITMGSYLNIKITTPEDLLFAKAILANKNFNT